MRMAAERSTAVVPWRPRVSEAGVWSPEVKGIPFRLEALLRRLSGGTLGKMSAATCAVAQKLPRGHYVNTQVCELRHRADQVAPPRCAARIRMPSAAPARTKTRLHQENAAANI
jgi:hypothetical protein